MINLSLPFYGKKGSISQITENEKSYSVSEYDVNGENNLTLTVPNKNKNRKEIIALYYQNVKEYLEVNDNKYKSYRSSRLKKPIDIKNVETGFYASLGGMSLSVILFTLGYTSGLTELISYILVVIGAISTSSLVYTIDQKRKYLEDGKKAAFISEYDQYNRDLNSYYSSLEHEPSKPTKYNGLNKDKSISNTLNKKKVKVLDEYKKVS